MNNNTTDTTHTPTNAEAVLPQEGVALGKDLDNADIGAWAASVRQSFGKDRKGYNFAVCDELAKRGVPVNANTVLRIGRWGQNTSVAQDVQDWYKTLASRLQSMEANVPLSARRHANALLDQLFAVARDVANDELERKIQPHILAHETTKGLLNAAQNSASEFEIEATRLQSELDGLTAEHKTQSEQLDAANKNAIALNDALQSKSRELEQLRGELSAQKQLNERQASQSKHELLQAETKHAEKLLETQQFAEAERRRVMVAADSQKVAVENTLKSTQAELAEARKRIDVLSSQNTASSIQLASALSSLDGANTLRATEQRHFEGEIARLKQEAPALLLQFIRVARKAGIHIAWQEDARKDEVEKIGRLMGFDATLAAKIIDVVPEYDPKKK